jgi:hypothetical protein
MIFNVLTLGGGSVFVVCLATPASLGSTFGAAPIRTFFAIFHILQALYLNSVVSSNIIEDDDVGRASVRICFLLLLMPP